MAQKKSHEVEAWLKNPDPGVSVLLVYGPDRGLVSERSRLFVAGAGLDAEDPFSSVRFDAAELEFQPGRLSDEAHTVPMFSSRRLIWVKGAGAHKHLADELKELAANPPGDVVIVIEAGDLKKGAPLRSAAENAAAAMALPCYADEGRSIDAVIDEILARENLTIGMEARHALRASLGGDRLASRAEVEKLALYCMGRREITVDDVRLLTGDVSGFGVDDAVDAVLTGDADSFDNSFSRLVASGSHPFVALSAALRQFQLMRLLRGEMDSSGKPASAVVASARPPVFFARRRLVENALQRWNGVALARACERLHASILQTRRNPELAVASARQALMALVVEAARSRR